MTLEKAQSILEPFLNKDAGLLDIKFYGGETLMAFNVIKPLIEWIEKRQWKRSYRFFGSTNGTLLTEDMKVWLTNHSNILTLGLSYDGTPTSQTMNRGVDSVDIDFFIKTWPIQPIQMTINEQSVSSMAEGVEYLLKKGAVVHPNVAFEEKEWSEESLAEYSKQLYKLIHIYNSNPNYSAITQFEHNIQEYAEQIESPQKATRMCGAGDGFQMFDVDGQCYPCHLLSPLVIGGESLDNIKRGALSNTTDFSAPDCNSCPFSTSCPTCLASNYIYRGDFTKQDRTHCEIMKLEVRAFIKKEVLRLMAKESLTQREASQIEAIRKVKNYLQNNAN